MTVDFALFLSPDGIGLAHRQTAGHWALVAETPLDDADFSAGMARLTSAAAERGGGNASVLLVLPDDQVLYTSVTAPTGNASVVRARIRSALDGVTPYAVKDLVFDWRAVEEDRVKVAVIARETLQEATEFVKAHGFQGAGFAAMPPAERFPGMPIFGRRKAALKLDADGMTFGADEWTDPARPAAEPAGEPSEAGQKAPGPAAEDADRQEHIGPAEPAGAEAPVPSTRPEADPPPEDATAAPETAAETEPPAPISDPAMQAVVGMPGPAQPDVAAATDKPVAEPELPPGDETAEKTHSPLLDRVLENARVRAADDPPEAPSPPQETGTDRPAALSFSARRGKTGAPEKGVGRIVSTRKPRMALVDRGNGHSEDPYGSPDAPEPAKDGPVSGAAKTATARPESRLAAQLARVRDASKTRPTDGRGPVTPTAPPSRPAFERSGDTSPTPVEGSRPEAKSQATAPGAGKDGGLTADDAVTGGLLARKPAESGKPSRRAGVVLTLILLFLLALIALWSIFFLPDSPLARILNDPAGREVAAVDQAPLDIPTPTPEAALPDADPDAEADGPGDLAALPPAPDTRPTTGGAARDGSAERVPLPDIDADLDLPPLPPLPTDLLPSVAETERIYAEDGIWPRTPDRPSFAPFAIIDDIYVASIDPAVPITDALALPGPSLDPLQRLQRVPSPPAFGAEIARDARGLVTPTPEGVLGPDGAFVIAGRPPVASIPRPEAPAAPAPSDPAIDTQRAGLGAFGPLPRPADLDETRERQELGGLTQDELAARRPAPRPVSAQEVAARASLFPQSQGQGTAPAPGPSETAPAPTGTGLAVAASPIPESRPSNIAAIVAGADRAPPEVPVVAAAAVAVQPSIPSSANVSRVATERNVIRLRNVNLIGVTGTPSNRRALIRLPSGRFVRVGVGDQLDGGRVAAIGPNSLQYVRNGRNVTLDIPG